MTAVCLATRAPPGGLCHVVHIPPPTQNGPAESNLLLKSPGRPRYTGLASPPALSVTLAEFLKLSKRASQSTKGD